MIPDGDLGMQEGWRTRKDVYVCKLKWMLTVQICNNNIWIEYEICMQLNDNNSKWVERAGKAVPALSEWGEKDSICESSRSAGISRSAVKKQ